MGYTEEQLKANGKAYKVGSFPFKASGRARANMDTDGFVKVLANKTTDEILGVHMIGPRIAHLTYAEAIKEACLAATENRAIHM